MRFMDQPFIGSEALASGALERRHLRRYCQAIMPNVYLDKRVDPSLRQRSVAAWLWSGREAVVAGLAAAAIHGSEFVDDDATVELIWKNARAPRGVVTRDELLLPGEFERREDLAVTTPARTAFDLGRRGRLDHAVARLDALAAATRFKPCEVADLASRHSHTRGLRQLEKTLDLIDAGSESPRETWLRLLVVNAGYPRPRTQIPVPKPDGWGYYYLDMGWENIMLAIEYDGGQHWANSERVAYDIKRAEHLNDVGWNIVRVMKAHRAADVLSRLRRAWSNTMR